MVILSLICGLGIGTYLPIDMSVIIAAGMIISIMTPVLSPLVAMFGLGLGVAVTCKNVIKTAYNKKVQKVKERTPKTKLETIAIEASTEAHNEFSFFSSTMAFTALPMMLLQSITALYQFLLPVSVLALVVKAWFTIANEPVKAIKYSVIGILIAAAAFLTISSGNASSVFLYFLTLVSLPSALSKKQETDTQVETKESNTTMPLEAFLYGQAGNGSIITAMVLLQTILWGSGKDTLGTIVNGSGSMLLDPLRLTIFGVVIVFIILFSKYRKDVEINKLTQNLINKKRPSRLLGILVNLASLGFAMTTVNPLLAISMTLIGLILNAFIDTSAIRTMAVPMLLVLGVAVG